MKIILITLTILTLSTNASLAEKFIQGNSYQGHFNYSTGVTVSFPPGTWIATKVKIHNFSEVWWDDKGQFVSLVFKNELSNAYIFINMPDEKLDGDYFKPSLLKPCWTILKAKEERGGTYMAYAETNVHSSGIQRGGESTAYCIQDINLNEGINIDNGSYLDVTFEVTTKMKGSRPLVWLRYSIYYDLKNSNVSALSETELEEVGKSLNKILINNVRGKPGDFSKVSKLIKLENDLEPASTSLSSSSTSSSSVQTSDPNHLKERLKKLKSFLDDGLISQDQYDLKSSEILNEL